MAKYIHVFLYIFVIITICIIIYQQNDTTNSRIFTDQKQIDPKVHLEQTTVNIANLDPLQQLKLLVDKPNTKNPTQTDLQMADEILDFCNVATETFNYGWFAQADLIAFFVRIYLGEWQVAILPKNEDTANDIAKLTPNSDLFSEETRNYLTAELKKMSQALDKMLADYDRLTKYFQDDSVIDEGIKGKQLAAQITANYSLFQTARKNYFGVLDEESKIAEDVYLTSAPLRRQIMAARFLFALFQEVSWSIAEDKPRAKTRKLHTQLQNIYDYAAAPPFRGKPLLERSYREFLKDVAIYLEVLAQGNEEGFYPDTRKDLNNCLANCRSSYNEFAAELNTITP